MCQELERLSEALLGHVAGCDLRTVLHGQKYTLESETQKSKFNDPIVRIDVGVG